MCGGGMVPVRRRPGSALCVQRAVVGACDRRLGVVQPARISSVCSSRSSMSLLHCLLVSSTQLPSPLLPPRSMASSEGFRSARQLTTDGPTGTADGVGRAQRADRGRAIIDPRFPNAWASGQCGAGPALRVGIVLRCIRVRPVPQRWWQRRPTASDGCMVRCARRCISLVLIDFCQPITMLFPMVPSRS